jgi:hypothetical protein
VQPSIVELPSSPAGVSDALVADQMIAAVMEVLSRAERIWSARAR